MQIKHFVLYTLDLVKDFILHVTSFIWLVRCMFKAVFVFVNFTTMGFVNELLYPVLFDYGVIHGMPKFLVFHWSFENDSRDL